MCFRRASSGIVLDARLDGALDTLCEIFWTPCDLPRRGGKDRVETAKVGELAEVEFSPKSRQILL